MSAFLLGTGFRADMGTCIRKLVLLKLIDACEDDGTRIFPAMRTVARAAQCSERQVQREIKSFLDIGLLRLVKEGGKGPRSTNEYALDLDMLHLLGKAGWEAVARGANVAEKGDTQSPLEGAEKGDTGDAERVTPATDKGDTWSHPTPPDPSLDPSIERERGREEGEDRKKIEARGWALLKDWPGFAGMPKEPAMRVWRAMSAEDRDKAERRFPGWLALLKAQKKSHIPAPSSYFGQKLFEDVPEPGEAAEPEFVEAKPFGPIWGGSIFRELMLAAAQPSPAPNSAFLAELLARDDEPGRIERLKRQAAHGWPKVNFWLRQADSRKGFTAPVSDRALIPLMEPVPVGSPLFAEWRGEFQRRGWPWLPDPGGQPVIYFPAGGPGALSEFEQAVRGNQDDAGRREAAE